MSEVHVKSCLEPVFLVDVPSPAPLLDLRGVVSLGVLKTLPGKSTNGLTPFMTSGVLKRSEPPPNGENTPLSKSDTALEDEVIWVPTSPSTGPTRATLTVDAAHGVKGLVSSALLECVFLGQGVWEEDDEVVVG